MNIERKITPSTEGQRQLEALRQAVDKTLEKKRRLGQYAVVWREGGPVRIGPSAPHGAGEYDMERSETAAEIRECDQYPDKDGRSE